MQRSKVNGMTVQEALADADGDIAALVYTKEDRPDLVLWSFARHLADAGRRPCGLIQFRDRSRGGSPGRVLIVENWQVVDVANKRGATGDGQCRLDADWLDRMGAQAVASIRRGVDAVIVNRFGPLEANGRGFSAAITAASETRTPLIVAVPEFEFRRWTRFSSGMTVKLSCDIDKALDWWRRISSCASSVAGSSASSSEVHGA